MADDLVEPNRAPISLSHRASQRKGLRLAAVIAICLAVFVVVAGMGIRMHDAAKLKSWAKIQSIPAVDVILPASQQAGQILTLPGDLQAEFNAPIYSRVSGYVHAWNVDIGARVKAGQVLATIDTPELDQQLIQARADLETANANLKLASTTAKRWASLLSQDAVSKQESDEKAGDFAAKSAMVNAAQANVDRLLALKSFSKIVAPFDGVVTARRTDIGDLVNAGAGAAPNSELFDVAEVDTLRLYVHVPQSYSSQITPGMTADFTVPEHPGQTFKAQLSSTSNAVSDNSGTLLVELAVNNTDGALQSGDYAQVKFNLQRQFKSVNPLLQVPASALLFRKEGLQVAIVDASNRVRLQAVAVGLDLGQSVEVSAGLKPTDRIVDNPPDSLSTGDLVRVVQPATSTSSTDARAATAPSTDDGG